MSLPELTHLQYLVLTLLEHGGAVSGIDLRNELLARGEAQRTLPAFYQLMERLADEKLLSADRRLGATHHTEVFYRIRTRGRSAIAESRAFYNEAFS